jgi:hypothetical protein
MSGEAATDGVTRRGRQHANARGASVQRNDIMPRTLVLAKA